LIFMHNPSIFFIATIHFVFPLNSFYFYFDYYLFYLKLFIKLIFFNFILFYFFFSSVRFVHIFYCYFFYFFCYYHPLWILLIAIKRIWTKNSINSLSPAIVKQYANKHINCMKTMAGKACTCWWTHKTTFSGTCHGLTILFRTGVSFLDFRAPPFFSFSFSFYFLHKERNKLNSFN